MVNLKSTMQVGCYGEKSRFGKMPSLLLTILLFVIVICGTLSGCDKASVAVSNSEGNSTVSDSTSDEEEADPDGNKDGQQARNDIESDTGVSTSQGQDVNENIQQELNEGETAGSADNGISSSGGEDVQNQDLLTGPSSENLYDGINQISESIAEVTQMVSGLQGDTENLKALLTDQSRTIRFLRVVILIQAIMLTLAFANTIVILVRAKGYHAETIDTVSEELPSTEDIQKLEKEVLTELRKLSSEMQTFNETTGQMKADIRNLNTFHPTLPRNITQNSWEKVYFRVIDDNGTFRQTTKLEKTTKNKAHFYGELIGKNIYALYPDVLPDAEIQSLGLYNSANLKSCFDIDPAEPSGARDYVRISDCTSATIELDKGNVYVLTNKGRLVVV